MRSKTHQIRIGHDITTGTSFESFPGLNFLQVAPDGSVRHTYQDGESNFHLDTDDGFELFMILLKNGANDDLRRQFKTLLNIKN